MPLITRHIGRRLADADQLEPLVHVMGATALPEIRHQLLEGMRDGLEGRVNASPPTNWPTVYAKLSALGDDTARIATGLAQQFGDADAAQKMLVTLQDDSADVANRREALLGLATQQRPELKEHLIQLLEDQELRRDAIRAMAAFEDRKLARVLLERYDEFSDDDKLEAVQTLASRSQYGRALTEAIKREEIPRRDIPAYIARQLQRVVGNGFLEVWGSVESLSADKEVELNRYRELLTPAALAAADPSRGRETFKRTCAACHKLYGEGGVVGPDITGANRPNLEYLLSNILTPSAVIQDAYRMTMIVTQYGRVYSGILAGENDRQVSLWVAGQDEPIIIPKSQIEDREIALVSMMPEGQLRYMSDAEVANLIAYLQTTQQVPLLESQ
jgi:putative heme-binding domain-containing protein